MIDMADKSPRIVFFVPEWPVSGSAVLHSQVLTAASFLSANGAQCLFVGCERTRELAKEAEESIRKTYHIEAFVSQGYADKYGYFGRWFYCHRIYQAALDRMREFSPTHIYARAHIDSTFARKAARKLGAISVFDVRSVAAEEVALRRGKKDWRYRLVDMLELREVKKADRLLCVSENLKAVIRQRTSREATVVPCCFDEKRFHFDRGSRDRIREELGFGASDMVICYSGGLSKWQKIEAILRLFEQIAAAGPEFKFLFLTSQTRQMEEIAARASLPRDSYRIVGCPIDVVSRYLSSSDAGIIMRDDVIVNNVASPIKIGEYLSCGLPVILTRGIGDFSETVPRAGLGFLLEDGPETVTDLIRYVRAAFHADNRQMASRFAIDNLTFKNHLDSYQRVYS
jgi:glycosyltransferase involved in cell wall biosynthesis